MNEDTRYQNAKQRVEELKGFYIHIALYIVGNLALTAFNLLLTPENTWFYWPLAGWGIGLAIHAANVFAVGKFLGADWEERKIHKIMNQE